MVRYSNYNLQLNHKLNIQYLYHNNKLISELLIMTVLLLNDDKLIIDMSSVQSACL